VDFTPPTSDLPRGLAISPPVYFDEDPGPEEIRHWVEAARLTLITLGSQNALGTRYCLTSSRCLLYLKKATRVVQIRPMRGREAGFLRVPHWWCTTPTPVTKSVSTCASWSFSGELHWHPTFWGLLDDDQEWPSTFEVQGSGSLQDRLLIAVTLLFGRRGGSVKVVERLQERHL
jgi:hypothetical protein